MCKSVLIYIGFDEQRHHMESMSDFSQDIIVLILRFYPQLCWEWRVEWIPAVKEVKRLLSLIFHKKQSKYRCIQTS